MLVPFDVQFALRRAGLIPKFFASGPAPCGRLRRFGVRPVLVTLQRLEVEFHPEPFIGRADEAVRVRAVAIHVAHAGRHYHAATGLILRNEVRAAHRSPVVCAAVQLRPVAQGISTGSSSSSNARHAKFPPYWQRRKVSRPNACHVGDHPVASLLNPLNLRAPRGVCLSPQDVALELCPGEIVLYSMINVSFLALLAGVVVLFCALSVDELRGV